MLSQCLTKAELELGRFVIKQFTHVNILTYSLMFGMVHRHSVYHTHTQCGILNIRRHMIILFIFV